MNPVTWAIVVTVLATDVPTSASCWPVPDSESKGPRRVSPTRGSPPTLPAAPVMLSRNPFPADVSPSAGPRSAPIPSLTARPSHTHTATQHRTTTSATI